MRNNSSPLRRRCIASLRGRRAALEPFRHVRGFRPRDGRNGSSSWRRRNRANARRKTVKKLFGVGAFLIFAGVAVAAGPSSTSGPTWVSASASINSNGFLVASFKESGLAPGTTETYELSATETAVYSCIASGHGKRALGSSATTGPLSGTNDPGLTVKNNGVVVGGAALDPPSPPADFVCPSGTTLTLTSISYEGATLTDMSNSSGSGPAATSAPLTGSCTSSTTCSATF